MWIFKLVRLKFASCSANGDCAKSHASFNHHEEYRMIVMGAVTRFHGIGKRAVQEGSLRGSGLLKGIGISYVLAVLSVCPP